MRHRSVVRRRGSPLLGQFPHLPGSSHRRLMLLWMSFRSCEVLALNRETRPCCFPNSHMRVCGKGNKLRWLPLAPETIQLLDHYLLLERPSQQRFAAVSDPQGACPRSPHDSRRVVLVAITAASRICPKPTHTNFVNCFNPLRRSVCPNFLADFPLMQKLDQPVVR